MSSFFALIRQSLGVAPKVSGKVAKDRLSIMLVHQRNKDALADINMQAMQKEVAEVVTKYLKVNNNKPSTVVVNQQGEFDFLEMHFPLSDTETPSRKNQKL